MAHQQTPVEISRETNYNGKALKYQTITWRDAGGIERKWETVERARGQEAVMTIPWLRPSERLLLIRQYRPPLGRDVIEFPAGLIDAGETAEVAALRELREEAGYTGRVTRVIAPTCNTPGLSSEAVYQVFVEIDEETESNQSPEAEPDDGECIETVLVSRQDIAAFIEQSNEVFDSKVMAYCLGLSDEHAAGRQA